MDITKRRHFFTALILSASTVLLGGCSTALTPEAKKNAFADSDAASMVMTNGVIYTMDRQNTIASAVAISGDRILLVGSDSDVKSFIGEDTKVIDLAGKMLIPGFVDSHAIRPNASWQQPGT